jgi:hypothetical protein
VLTGSVPPHLQGNIDATLQFCEFVAKAEAHTHVANDDHYENMRRRLFASVLCDEQQAKRCKCYGNSTAVSPAQNLAKSCTCSFFRLLLSGRWCPLQAQHMWACIVKGTLLDVVFGYSSKTLAAHLM